jgi:hypothetical protein
MVAPLPSTLPPNGSARRYGANFEFSYKSAVFSPTRFGVELRPIIGVRNADFEFIVNPIVDIAAGHYGSTTFAPAVRLAHKFERDFDLGLEYYGDFGQIGHFAPLKDQQHTAVRRHRFQVRRHRREFRRRPQLYAGCGSIRF